MLIRPGSELHAYEPTPADVLAIADCDLFLYIGGESDAWVLDILESFGSEAPPALRFFDCVEAIEAEDAEGEILSDGHGHAHEYDEHIWTSPVNAAAMVEALSASLCALCPDQAEEFQANARRYGAEILEIDGEIRSIVASAARREMIFADRFPFLYFVREYGLDYCAAFPSCASESEPSAKTLAELIGRVARDGVPAVYVLELSNGKTAQAIAEETGAEVLTFYSMQTVSEADFAAGESYLSLMRRNIDALRRGLN